MLLLRSSVVFTVAFLSLLMTGCPAPHHPKESKGGAARASLRLFLFLDRTGSCQALRPEFVRYSAQAAVLAPAGTTVEACAFGSDIRVAPFYEGPVRGAARFAKACQSALAVPSPGRGTF